MSSLPRSRSNGTPSLNEQETWGDDDMVTQQLSAESAVSQLLLYPLSTSSVATGMTTAGGSHTSSTTSPTEAKTPLDSDGATATGTLNGFDLGGFLHVEELTNIDTDASGLFTLPATTTGSNGDDGNDSNASSNLTTAKSPRPSPIVLAPKSQSIDTDCTSPTHSDSTIKTASPTSIDSPTTPQLDGTDTSRRRPNGGRKRKAESLEEKEARARERILRNRHAAQMSRDKKRRQLIELEAQNAALIEQNALLREENAQMTKRVKLIEDDNSTLSTKFEAISAQLSEIQSTLAISEVTKFLFDGARGSAVSAALEHSALATTANDDGKQRRERVARSTRSSLPNSCSLSTSSTTVFIRRRQERSRKSQQRPVKMRNLYGTPIQQSFRNWSRPRRLLMQLFLSLSIAFSTTTGQPTYLWFPSNSNKISSHRKASVNDVVISVLRQRFDERYRLRSVKAKRGHGANIRLVPRDWRKYPP